MSDYSRFMFVAVVLTSISAVGLHAQEPESTVRGATPPPPHDLEKGGTRAPGATAGDPNRQATLSLDKARARAFTESDGPNRTEENWKAARSNPPGGPNALAVRSVDEMRARASSENDGPYRTEENWKADREKRADKAATYADRGEGPYEPPSTAERLGRRLLQADEYVDDSLPPVIVEQAETD